MIRLQIHEQLRNRSLYWLSKETGIAYSTIYKLATKPTKGISFVVLDKLCNVFNCNPGDLLIRDGQFEKVQRKIL